jgi:subtilisin family serine protease
LWEFDAGTPTEITARLGRQSAVRGFSPLVRHQPVLRYIPNDPLFPQQWHLLNTGQNGGSAGADINVTPAWDTVRGRNVVIGIVDDAVQVTHPDLSPNYNAQFSFDFIDNDADPSPVGLMPGAPGDFHGTSVAGVAAARGDNNLGVSGVAPRPQLAGRPVVVGSATEGHHVAHSR